MSDTVIYCIRHNLILAFPAVDEVEQRLAELQTRHGDSLIVTTFDEAYEIMRNAARSEPVEITRHKFDEAFNILPPVAWRDRGCDESFKMSEPLVADITAIYVRVGDRFFTFNDSMRMPHHACVIRVTQSLAFNITCETDDLQIRKSDDAEDRS